MRRPIGTQLETTLRDLAASRVTDAETFRGLMKQLQEETILMLAETMQASKAAVAEAADVDGDGPEDGGSVEEAGTPLAGSWEMVGPTLDAEREGASPDALDEDGQAVGSDREEVEDMLVFD